MMKAGIPTTVASSAMLVLEIDWLMGMCFAARDPSDPAPDWPPQPDRIFSALVAAWGARGCDAGERTALEWLEEQAPPVLHHITARQRTTVTVFVPPNDAAVSDIRILPERRRRQPRQFPATALESETPHLRLIWRDAEAGDRFDALQALAKDTSYVGHSSSVVCCRFTREAADAPASQQAQRAPYQGRLAELTTLHERHMGGDERARPRPSTRAGAAAFTREWASPFASDWIVLEDAGGDRPDLRGAIAVAKTMRDALMQQYPDPIPEWLSGHAADGSPSKAPHLAIVPMANVGFDWSDGALMGLALVLPRDVEAAWREGTPKAWESKRCFGAAIDVLHRAQGDETFVALTLGRAGVWRLRRAGGVLRQSLRAERYCAAARVWTTATPIALDRHLKAEDREARLREAAALIEGSCVNLGLAKPARVRVHKHAATQGAPSAWPPGGAPAWQNWARPASLKARPLFHATIEFGDVVRGPLILGAGRFFGLGLCLPSGRAS